MICMFGEVSISRNWADISSVGMKPDEAWRERVMDDADDATLDRDDEDKPCFIRYISS